MRMRAFAMPEYQVFPDDTMRFMQFLNNNGNTPSDPPATGRAALSQPPLPPIICRLQQPS